MKSMNKKIIQIEFDSNVYSLQAVKNAAYDYNAKAWFHIRLNEKGKIIVSVTPKSEISETLQSDFINHVLDHQVRIDVSGEFKIIREMIVAQAFEPCDNLKEIVETLIHEQVKDRAL